MNVVNLQICDLAPLKYLERLKLYAVHGVLVQRENTLLPRPAPARSRSTHTRVYATARQLVEQRHLSNMQEGEGCKSKFGVEISVNGSFSVPPASER